MWFKNLTGFVEENPTQVRKYLEVNDNKLFSKVNSNQFVCGKLETPTLEELLKLTYFKNNYNSKIKISELVGNTSNLHKDIANAGALFQAASQFNLLEMISPNVTPERGIDIYENDQTQGPACAIACGAGTIYRNYFANVNNETGQSANNQIDCLKDIGLEFKNELLNLWKMQNGYALVNNVEALKIISKQINNKSIEEYENLKQKLRIGIQWNTEVTISKEKQLVSQAYCSALPISYSHIDIEYWTDFARMILEATYEATFCAALLNYKQTNNNKLFLTLVGGGAFGNKIEWILEAIQKCLIKFSNTPLDVRIVSYGYSNPKVVEFINKITTSMSDFSLDS